MASAAQILANQANSRLSTGPVSDESKAHVSQNRLVHGLTGDFQILPWEQPEQFQDFTDELTSEHTPQTPFEHRLVSSMIQHYWLMQRALTLQGHLLLEGNSLNDSDQKKLALLLRYQTTHERSYNRAIRDLQTLRKQKRQDEIGFESQKQKQELHEAKVRLINAQAAAQEIATAVRQTVEVPLPGNTRIPFTEIQDACAAAVRSLVEETLVRKTPVHETPKKQAA